MVSKARESKEPLQTNIVSMDKRDIVFAQTKPKQVQLENKNKLQLK